MKKIIILACVFVSGLAFAEDDHQGPNPNGQWFYNQRAFPDKAIPTRVKEFSFNSLKNFLKRGGHDSSGLTWQPLGPGNIGGRVTDVVASPDFPNRVYIGTAESGVWKSDDAGGNFYPIFEDEGIKSIGALAIDPNDANTLWVGTGESNPAYDTYPGIGIFVSHDAGNTFQRQGLEESGRISRIRIDPRNSKHIFAAVLGDIYIPSLNRGVYETKDGGKTWNNILASSIDPEKTGAVELIFNPTNPDEMFAGLWDLFRTKTTTKKGGPGTGLYHTLDGGKTWEHLTGNGLPVFDEKSGRIEITYAPQNPKIMYASFDEIGVGLRGLVRSDDGGKTWAPLHGMEMPGDDGLKNYGWWFGKIQVSPKDPDTLYVLGLNLWKSTDGGKSFVNLNLTDGKDVPHADQHALWIYPQNPDRIYLGNDGGFYSSEDGGKTFTHASLPITQFYHLTVDPKNPDHIYGGAQDNNVLRTLTGAMNDWSAIYGGDGIAILLDPNNPKTIYVEAQDGDLNFSSDDFATSQAIRPKDLKRSGWDTPIMLDPKNSNTVYFGGESLYQSDDQGTSWKTISNEFEILPTGAIRDTYVVNTMDIAPLDPKIIYAATDVGHIFLTQDHGAHWSNISGNLPQRTFTKVKLRADNPAEVFVTISGYAFGQSASHVYRSQDFGKTWINVGQSLPEAPVNVIALDPVDCNTYYLGSDVGVFVTRDAGVHWEFLGNGFPSMIPVTDMSVDGGGKLLTVATHGRGMWRLQLRRASATK